MHEARVRKSSAEKMIRDSFSQRIPIQEGVMKKLFVWVLAGLFILSLSGPSISYAKKGGQPAVKASDEAKGQTAEKAEKNATTQKNEGKKKGETKGKKEGQDKGAKKGATPATKATPATPTPGTPGATNATPATPATPPEPKK
jgi:hypothetical protein